VRQIPAGGEGIITLKFNTNGYGGRRTRDSARIKANDANRSWLDVSVTGLVEKFVDINPPRANFRGPVGTFMKARIVIMPKEKYPFKITGSRARQGKYFKFELSEQMQAGELQYVLVVENIRQKKGRYADVIYLDTDSKIRPRIQVQVLGYLYEQKKAQKE
jgi:hypothetical protein